VGNWCSITTPTCGDGTRRSSGKPIVPWSDLVIGRRPPIGLSNRIIGVGVRAFSAWDRGAEEVAHHPYEPPRVISFAAAGAEGVVVAPIT
jgi:hypothetical protein